MQGNSIAKKIDDFFSQYTTLSYKKDEIILRADDRPPGILYLKKGLVRQYVVSQKGEILVIHIFRPGAFFQMMWAINDADNSYYYDAISAVTIYRAPLADVREFMKSEPAILYSYTERLLRGLDGLVKRLEYLVLDPVYVRISSLLSYFAKTFGEKDGPDTIIRLPLTHKEIASWIGTTRETASLKIEELKREKIIGNKGRILLVKNLKALEQIASFGDLSPHL